MQDRDNNIKKALVVGLGYRTGLAVCNFLIGRGATVVASDSKSETELSEVLQKLDPAVRVVTGEQRTGLLDEGFDTVILSPGVPRNIPLVTEAYRRKIPVTAEVELAYRYLRGVIVGITGTDGKSTTTALTGHVLRELGMSVHVGGNIGIPLITFVDRTSDSSVIVAELSSFQLEAIERFRPDVSALLNVTPDHLDRYAGMDDYFAAKMRIAMNQKDDDCFIYNRDDAMACAGAQGVKSRTASFSLECDDADIYYHDGAVYLREGGRKVLRREAMTIMGLHNVQNAMASILVVRAVMHKKGMTPDYDAFAEAVYSFPGLEHRLERIGVYQGREFINDSKATTVNAVLTAIRSLPAEGVLILGGRTKGDDYSRLSSGMNGRIRALVLIGESKDYFSKIFSGNRLVTADTLDDAVVKAMKESREGDVIILSPACASFDMFNNYEERGGEFKKSFHRLASGALPWI
ncbi:MAG: UDP-N-acetylmuramoylalanine--D-glutamate ligase [Spirochaetes bacterium RBG_13_51_14]|nr:MAG: UDP-N-acetylmuramoylalanine--D-glutamate ligase [Spirochaetes bacterium RBG_13_51_14]